MNAATLGLTDGLLEYESTKKKQTETYTQPENPHSDDYFLKLGVAVANSLTMTERDAKTSRRGVPVISIGATT